MNAKTENPTTTKATSTAKTDALSTPAPEKVTTTASELPAKTAETVSSSASPTDARDGSNPAALSPEILELLAELRDTVKGINPRKHTPKTLRRALSNVSDILTDIDKLYPQD